MDIAIIIFIVVGIIVAIVVGGYVEATRFIQNSAYARILIQKIKGV